MPLAESDNLQCSLFKPVPYITANKPLFLESWYASEGASHLGPSCFVCNAGRAEWFGSGLFGEM